MKLLITLLIIGLFPLLAHASQGKHRYGNDDRYDCSATNKPSKISWVKFSKNDIRGNGIIKFTWKDSAKAHDVEMMINTKKRKTEDDGRYTLRVNEPVSIKIRGVSNCGKGSWSKVYKAQP